MPIFLKFLQMGTEADGYLGQMELWGKGYPKCLKRVPPRVFLKFLRMGMRANGHLEKIDVLKKGVLQVP